MQLTDWVGMPTILSTGYCYTYLAISSLAVVVTIASTYYAYLGKVGQAELAWVAWLNTCEQWPGLTYGNLLMCLTTNRNWQLADMSAWEWLVNWLGDLMCQWDDVECIGIKRSFNTQAGTAELGVNWPDIVRYEVHVQHLSTVFVGFRCYMQSEQVVSVCACKETLGKQ